MQRGCTPAQLVRAHGALLAVLDAALHARQRLTARWTAHACQPPHQITIYCPAVLLTVCWYWVLWLDRGFYVLVGHDYDTADLRWL